MSFDEEGNTDLINAILEEDHDLAVELLDTLPEEELQINHVNYHHRDALQLACEKGMAEIALRLIELGSDTNYVGGQGYKALDYAVALLQNAKTTIEKAEPQMQFAAEDGQWDLVCEFREEQKQMVSVLKEMPEVIEALESRLPLETEEDAKDRLRQQIMQFLRAGRTTDVKWTTESNIPGTLFFLHLMRTYRQSTCYVNTQLDAGLALWFDLEKRILRVGLEHMAPYSSPDAIAPLKNAVEIRKEANKALETVVGQIAKCLRKGIQQVIIPLTLEDANDANVRHTNILIFRVRDWSLEHYEPHGKTNMLDYWNKPEGIRNNTLLHEMISGVFERLKTLLDRRIGKWKMFKERVNGQAQIKLLTSMDTCPSHRGFQALQKKDPEFEARGLCHAWTLFMAELSAAHPSLSIRQIQNTIYSKMAEYDVSMAGDFLLNVIKGFVARILETTRVYSSYFDVREEEWSFAAIHRKNPYKRINWLCWFESKRVYDSEYAVKRLRMYEKNPKGEVRKEEAKYAAKYVALFSHVGSSSQNKRKTRKNRPK